MLFQLPPPDLRTRNLRRKKPSVNIFSLCLITACKVKFVPWHYNHIHFRTILENDQHYLFNTPVMYK